MSTGVGKIFISILLATNAPKPNITFLPNSSPRVLIYAARKTGQGGKKVSCPAHQNTTKTARFSPSGGSRAIRQRPRIVNPSGDEGDRTLNPCLAKAVLSQLSYVPKLCKPEKHCETAFFSLKTGLYGQWAVQDSNL